MGYAHLPPYKDTSILRTITSLISPLSHPGNNFYKEPPYALLIQLVHWDFVVLRYQMLLAVLKKYSCNMNEAMESMVPKENRTT